MCQAQKMESCYAASLGHNQECVRDIQEQAELVMGSQAAG